MCNGEKDLDLVLRSGVLCNVAISARSHDVEVRKEAFWAISGLLAQVVGEKDVARVVKDLELVPLMIETFKLEENPQIIILALNSLEALLYKAETLRAQILH
jgi:hypothetical protein